MIRIIRVSLFILVAASILFLLHLFVFKNISKLSYLNQKSLFIIKIVFIISGISVFIGPISDRFLNIHFIKNYAYIWLGTITIVFSFMLLSAILRIFLTKKTDLNITVFIIIGILISGFSLVNQSQKPRVKNIHIHLKKTRINKKVIKIVQISDLHVERDTSIDRLIYIQEKINNYNPDVIVFTGDIIEYSGVDGRVLNIFKNMNAGIGKFAVTGNHEYYVGIDSFYKFAKNASIKILENETIKINETVTISGIDDYMSAKAGNFDPDLYPFLKKLDKSNYNILLAHRPYGFMDFSEHGIDLQLSGHTHAGQIPPMDLIVQIYYKYPSGFYEYNNSHIYTSPGTGYWGPPMRFLSRSEILFLEISN